MNFVKHNKKFVITIAILFIISIFLQGAIDKTEDKQKMTEMNPLSELPPSDYIMQYVGNILLGGLKPLAIDYLWMKCDDVKRENRYDELLLLLNFIGKMQPHIPVVWSFNSWNMAYNISRNTVHKEKEYKWIKQGIQYAEEGLKWNKDSSELYEWIGYTYYNRIPQDKTKALANYIYKDQGIDYNSLAIKWLDKAQKMLQKEGNYRRARGWRGVMMECYEGEIFEFLRLGKSEKEVMAAYNEACFYIKNEISKKNVPIFWNDVYDAFKNLKPVIKLELEFQQMLKNKTDDNNIKIMATKIISGYENVIRKYDKVIFEKITERLIFYYKNFYIEPVLLARNGSIDNYDSSIIQLQMFENYITTVVPRNHVVFKPLEKHKKQVSLLVNVLNEEKEAQIAKSKSNREEFILHIDNAIGYCETAINNANTLFNQIFEREVKVLKRFYDGK